MKLYGTLWNVYEFYAYIWYAEFQISDHLRYLKKIPKNIFNYIQLYGPICNYMNFMHISHIQNFRYLNFFQISYYTIHPNTNAVELLLVTLNDYLRIHPSFHSYTSFPYLHYPTRYSPIDSLQTITYHTHDHGNLKKRITVYIYVL